MKYQKGSLAVRNGVLTALLTPEARAEFGDGLPRVSVGFQPTPASPARARGLRCSATADGTCQLASRPCHATCTWAPEPKAAP